eukprot:CAMPEP_0180658906 /NCGR_PEP_ID=MMETSP1037_2-20121125/57277_1 /TAXON_ID=632150 /ORGANISM="Azadinium spinosum, Strain 3D9" /LENGTH=226 /DNA_ID=CAMNT_0022685871 /DNA_START=6 /DNA_END=686 /DNA_ORIENTATION=-
MATSGKMHNCTYDTRRTPPGWIRVQPSPIPEHTGIYRLHLQAQETLRTALVRESVKKPAGVDSDAWIAAQTVGVFQEVVTMVNLMEEFCTKKTCRHMCCGTLTYDWSDEKNPEPKKLPAIEYMRNLVAYAQRLLADYVPEDDIPFHGNFVPVMQSLHKRFFRVYAHAYLHHFQVIKDNGAEAHLNCCFKRFLFFVKEFELVYDADMVCLRDLIKKFEHRAATSTSL